MTKPKSTDKQGQSRKQQYLARMFAMHPMWQASQMLALRRKAMGIKAIRKADTSVKDSAKLATLRADVKQRIVKIQKDFWSMPLEQLKRHLETLPVSKLPEFKPVVHRLRTTASCRGQFPALTQAKAMDMNLFRAFKAAVVLPPAEAGYQREKFLQSIRDRGRLNEVKLAVKHIRNEHEMLYRLEADWFETILSLKKPRDAGSMGQSEYTTTGSSSFLPEMGWGAWFVAIIVIRIVFRLILANN